MKHLGLITLLILTACGAEIDLTNQMSTLGVANSSYSYAGASEPAARFIFHKDNFTDLSDYITSKHTQFQCLGDLVKTYYVSGADYTGTATAFPLSSQVDDFPLTNRPGFIRNVSLDMTQTYFLASQTSVVQTDACSYRGIASSSDPAPCADFDVAPPAAPAPTVVPTATPSPTPVVAATPISTQYFNTSYYRVRDDWCTGQGPLVSPSAETTKAYVGGVNIDLDRTQLGMAEDLLMVVTYQAFNDHQLVMTPETASLAALGTQTFTTTGGVGALTYAVVSGGGAINAATGVYTAPGAAASVQISVTDAITKQVRYASISVAGAAYPADLNQSWPFAQGTHDGTTLRVNLIGTALGLDTLLSARQPRSLTEFGSSQMPVYLKEIATLKDLSGSLRSEQVYIPLSENVLIDRIRLERVRGSFHLYQVDLYRLGNRAN